MWGFSGVLIFGSVRQVWGVKDLRFRDWGRIHLGSLLYRQESKKLSPSVGPRSVEKGARVWGAGFVLRGCFAGRYWMRRVPGLLLLSSILRKVSGSGVQG